MTCKRCGAEIHADDRFCRACGKRQKTKLLSEAHTTAFTQPADFNDAEQVPAVPLSTKKKWILFVCFGALLLVAALALIFLPHFKQSFMSPAAYYLESEAQEIRKFSDTVETLSKPIVEAQRKTINGNFKIETEGKEYEDYSLLLADLNLQGTLTTDGQKSTSLKLSAAYEEEVFCTVISNLVAEKISVSFPEMTDGVVAAKFSAALQNSFKGGNTSWKTITGYTPRELSEWVGTYLQPLLLEALNESEQTLDFAVVDGIEVSTVTFTLNEEQAKDVIRQLSSMIRRDTKLAQIIQNTANYITASAEFRRDFAAEFNLSDEDLEQIPLFTELLALVPEYTLPEEGSLLYVLNTSPEKQDVQAYVDLLADRIAEKADDLILSDGISLTAYYQGTDLIGRSLKQGTLTVFECFRYHRDNENILEVRLEANNEIYHLTHIDSSTATEGEHDITLTRLAADAERSADAGEETLLAISADLEKGSSIGGVSAFVGKVRLQYNDELILLSNERLNSKETRLCLERRTLSEGDVTSKIKLIGQLNYSASCDTADIQANSSSDFGKPAFFDLTLSMKRALQDTPVFEHYFGEGSLETFLAEEEKRLQEAGEQASSEEDAKGDGASEDDDTPDEEDPDSSPSASLENGNDSTTAE